MVWVPHGADFENVFNEDEAELCIHGCSLYFKKDLLRGPKKMMRLLVLACQHNEGFWLKNHVTNKGKR